MEHLAGTAGAVLGQLTGALIGGGIGLLVVMGAVGLLIRPWWGVVALAVAYAAWAILWNAVPPPLALFDLAAALLVGFASWGIARMMRRRPATA
jgi:hypothetical protein